MIKIDVNLEGLNALIFWTPDAKGTIFALFAFLS